MPLVSYEQIVELLPQGLRTVLSDTNRFDSLEHEASIIVQGETNVVIPADSTDAPAWCVTPMAWLISFLALPYFNNASDDLRKSVQDNYDRALSLLRKHKLAPNASAGRTGIIKGGWNRG